MFSFKLNPVLFLFIFHGYDCQRRIKDGSVVAEDKRYVVYLLKAPISPQYYEGWLCGGALVSEEYIVTSAACVTDVLHLYAIAGYNKYISDTEIYTDPCTRDKKKKIVFTCIPKKYELVYTKVEKWSYIDIAMAKVETPYNFNDNSYAQFCSYTPAPIEINYDQKYQEPGIDAIVLGWGHSAMYREEKDLTNYNQRMLNYASTLLEDKEICKREYAMYEGMGRVIDDYMICSNLKGNLDDLGMAIVAAAPTAQGCNVPLRGEPICDNPDGPDDQIALVENSRKDIKPNNFSTNGADHKSLNSSLINKMNKTVINSRRSNTRRNGICQNDHGGPLVTWIGAHEKLIGVAAAFKMTENRECIGPYLFTSTQCNGAFLDCILRGGDPSPGRRGYCSDILKEQGLTVVETHISWKDHPDGPAYNEKNGTTPVSAANEDTNNITVKQKTSEEERNKTHQEHNTTKIVNTNSTNTNNITTTYFTIGTTLTKTTKAANVSNSTPVNIININPANFKEHAPVVLTSGSSTNLNNNSFTTSRNIDAKSTKATFTNYQTNDYSLVSTIKNTITTILMKNATTNHTTTNLRNTSTTNA